ncbi:MAG: hypothetical protein JNL01_03595 [Bdellovibrionales bacterium]|nr:hypothetical protein [Bdellovibrionales bacterium]
MACLLAGVYVALIGMKFRAKFHSQMDGTVSAMNVLDATLCGAGGGCSGKPNPVPFYVTLKDPSQIRTLFQKGNYLCGSSESWRETSDAKGRKTVFCEADGKKRGPYVVLKKKGRSPASTYVESAGNYWNDQPAGAYINWDENGKKVDEGFFD